jgi:hypothetical protein
LNCGINGFVVLFLQVPILKLIRSASVAHHRGINGKHHCFDIWIRKAAQCWDDLSGEASEVCMMFPFTRTTPIVCAESCRRTPEA